MKPAAKKIKSRYQLCLSGAAKGSTVDEGRDLAYQCGVAIAKAGHMLLTGATTGLPHYAALGAKSVGGQSIGISPAASKVEHVKKYNLPIDAFDVILYTGLNYVGRDTLLIASSDAVITVGGRLGTLHEFTIAMEMDKPIGLLMGAGGVSEEIAHIMKAAGLRADQDVIYEKNPQTIVDKLTKMLDKDNRGHIDLYNGAHLRR